RAVLGRARAVLGCAGAPYSEVELNRFAVEGPWAVCCPVYHRLASLGDLPLPGGSRLSGGGDFPLALLGLPGYGARPERSPASSGAAHDTLTSTLHAGPATPQLQPQDRRVLRPLRRRLRQALRPL